MYNYPEQAKQEATHTDDFGNLYYVIGNTPCEFCVDYWDRRLNKWTQDLGKDFSYLIKLGAPGRKK